jgi:K+-sensing histidine kinase KdpD
MMKRGLTSMKVASCMLVGTEAPARAHARDAARKDFPDALVSEFDTLAEAMAREAQAGELLILVQPDARAVEQARAAVDRSGLRRWALVVMGRAAEGEESISEAELKAGHLGRIARSAITQQQLMRELERARGDLRTVGFRINHDLRTPLGGILGSADVIKEILAEEDPTQVGLVDPIYSSVDDLARVIERVSTLVKASANMATRGEVAMGETVWAAMQRRDRQIVKSKAAVAQPEDWPVVTGVASWLEAIWWNLLDNALQHGKPGGRIELGWRQEGGERRFWITSEGRVAPEKLESLFQPFHLLHLPNARKGMGLSIVQRLVELQGGHCGHEVTGDQRTTFFFTLPAGHE